MGRNSSGPTTAATVGEARKSDQLDGSITSENTKSVATTQAEGTGEQIETGVNLPRRRGRSKKSLALLDAIYAAAEAAQPITGRGVGYKLFVQKLLASMSRTDMQPVYRRLKEGREQGLIPWHWIVDETRGLEIRATWSKPPIAVPVRAEIVIELPVSASWSGKRRDAALHGDIRPTTRPDCDNYCKSAMDAINNIVVSDDSMIVDLVATKRYATVPALTIVITPLPALTAQGRPV